MTVESHLQRIPSEERAEAAKCLSAEKKGGAPVAMFNLTKVQ